MDSNNKWLGGLFSGMPSYHMLSSRSQNSQNNDLVKLIQQEENKFWSVRPLYLFATLQMISGVFLFLFSAQISLYKDDCFETKMQPITSYNFNGFESSPNIMSNHVWICRTGTFGLWCGGIIFFIGLISALATKYKTSFLLVLSSFLCVVGYGVSIYCLIVNAIYAQDEPNVRYRGTHIGMAVISGLNFLIFVLTSALFCRASCSCCQPQTPTIMYLSAVEDSTLDRQNEVSGLPR